MLIRLEMGPGFAGVVRGLGTMGRAVIKAAGVGLGKGAIDAAQKLKRDYLTGQALKNRSGDLRRAVDGWREGPLEAVVGVRPASAVDKYKWLLGDEEKTIVPRQSKFLAIPIGEGLTSTGRAKYKSPWDKPEGFFVKTNGRLLFGYKRGKTARAKFRPLFVLVKSVLVQGTGALWDAVDDSLDDITSEMQTEIDKVTGAGQ